jgi:DNA-binding response OmpR family regulator
VYETDYFQEFSHFQEGETMELESASPPNVKPSINPEFDKSSKITILLLEGDADLRNIITLTFLQQGMTVYAAPDPIKARSILEKENPDLFILELDNSEGNNGELIDLYRQNKNKEARCTVLLLTTQRPSDVWRNRFQPDLVIYKPFDIRLLFLRVTELIQKEKISTGKTS